jgi:hypothetical protein
MRVPAIGEEVLIRFERSPIRDFVPLLVERRAQLSLRRGFRSPANVGPPSGVDRQAG